MTRPASAYKLVVYLRGEGNYTWQHPEVGRPSITSMTLHRMITSHYPHLLRIHKSYAVDVSRIGRLVRTDENRYSVELQNGTLLDVSRRQLTNVKLALGITRRTPISQQTK